MSDATHGGAAEAHPEHLQHHFDTPNQQFESGKLGMWLFLAQELLFFGGVFCAYAVFRAHNPELFAFGASLLNWKMGAVNTVILICSSLTMAWGVRCSQLGDRKGLLVMLALTQVFASGFLVVKYFEYDQKIDHHLLWGDLYEPDNHYLEEHGYTLTLPEEPAAAGTEAAPMEVSPSVADEEGEDHGGTNGASNGAMNGETNGETGDDAGHEEGGEDEESHAAADDHGEDRGGGHLAGAFRQAPTNGHIFFGLYFFMTGLHLLHVLVGMGVIAWVMKGAYAGTYGPDYYSPVDIVGLYWHLVDLIWIFLFPLLYLI